MKPGNHPEMKSGRMILKAKQLHYSGGSKVRVPVCLVEGWNHQPKRTKTRGWVPPKLVVGIDGVPLFQGGFFRIHVKGWNHQLKIVPDNIPSQKKKDIYIYINIVSLCHHSSGSMDLRFHGWFQQTVPTSSWVFCVQILKIIKWQINPQSLPVYNVQGGPLLYSRKMGYKL